MHCGGMDLQYFKDHIAEELDGADEYIRLAIELKAMDSTWAKNLVEMSAAELDHAAKLFKMFENYCDLISKPYDEVPEYISDCRKKVIKMYTRRSAEVRYMHDMYSK